MEKIMPLVLLLLASHREAVKYITSFIKKNEIKWEVAYIPRQTVGYYIYYGTSTKDYIEKVRIVGKYTNIFDLRKLPLIKDTLYYLSITSFIVKKATKGKPCERIESTHSNEVTFIRMDKLKKRKMGIV